MDDPLADLDTTLRQDRVTVRTARASSGESRYRALADPDRVVAAGEDTTCSATDHVAVRERPVVCCVATDTYT